MSVTVRDLSACHARDGYSVIGVWFGVLNSVREVTKESKIYRRERLANLLGVEGTGDLDRHPELVRALGIDRIVAQASRGLDTKLSSSDLTRVEARAILLFDWLRHPMGSLWILDDPVEGLSRRRAAAWIDLIIRSTASSTVIMGLARLDPGIRFDRVHFMRKRHLTGSAL